MATYIIYKVPWLIAIAVTCVNAYHLRTRATAEIARNPELKEGYDQLLKGYLLCFNLPWLVMGIGIILGGTQSVFEYVDPPGGNPYVIAFHATGLILGALMVFWIYFAGGAEFLVQHPGVINVDIKSPLVFKLIFAFLLLIGMIAEMGVWSRTLLLLYPSQ